MADHWKSTPKYWCKHCSIYVKDTPFERKQHESTGKHQGNLKRFLQGIQKDHAKNEREKERTKAEIDRLNRITGASSSTASVQPPSPLTSSRPSKPASTVASAADQKRQWAQLADMGIAVPDHVRADMAMVGDWKTVSRQLENEPTQEELHDETLNKGVRKRKFEDEEAEEKAEDTLVRKSWGSTTKSYPGVKDDVDDLDTLLAAPLLKKDSKPPKEDLQTNSAKSDSNINAPDSTVKDENSSADIKPLEIRDRNDNFEATSLTHNSDVKSETTENATRKDGQASDIPIFKKRKAKQPQAARLVPG